MYIHSHTDHREGLMGRGWKGLSVSIHGGGDGGRACIYIYIYMHRELCGDEQRAAKDREWPKG